ncbi:MAG TPA: flagellar basal body L-ring protein [Parvularcula sp.]|nr:flagellar basal body L-ring protein [Parvularcula sp.]HBS30958.1 flagellar basal body L-ring protein [Parvularcula sp.]HBS34959.1 flagellar basal body L-ring protein [Parvularcula sp.]
MRKTFVISLLIAAAAPGCAALRASGLKAPEFSAPEMTQFAATAPAYLEDAPEPAAPGGLWRSGPQSLFGDRRARVVGDILTIVVEIDDSADLRNRTERKRDATEEVSVPALLGLNTLAQRVLPGGAGLDPAIDVSSASQSNGEGAIRRRERITLRIAAAVVDVTPNGNLVVRGSQEVRVNDEMRDLRVEGVVRREDITRANIIAYDKIAEARIAYGGKGDVSRTNRARYGQKVIDIVSPF